MRFQQREPKHDSSWMFTLVVFGICVLTLFSKLALRTWRWLEQRLDSLETTVRGIGSDLEQVDATGRSLRFCS